MQILRNIPLLFCVKIGKLTFAVMEILNEAAAATFWLVKSRIETIWNHRAARSVDQVRFFHDLFPTEKVS